MSEFKPVKRQNQKPVGHRRKVYTFRLEPGLIYRLRLLADDTNTTVSALLANAAEQTIQERMVPKAAIKARGIEGASHAART